MNASKALELLQPVPKEDFLIGTFTDEVSKCCAIGHLVRLTSDDPTNYSNDNCSDHGINAEEVTLFVRLEVNEFIIKKYDVHTLNLADINNYITCDLYEQTNPKDRVVALLKDIIQDEQVETDNLQA